MKRGRPRKKCTVSNPCDRHKEGKYLKWNCGNVYSKEKRHERYLSNKKPCNHCGKLATKQCCKNCYYKFHSHHLKGTKLPDWWIKNISNGQKKGEHNPLWKGDDASYSSKHKWVVKFYGNPVKCEDCGVLGKKNAGNKWTIQWANISKKYFRKLEDYKGLCTHCHKNFDGLIIATEDISHGTLKRYRRGCRCDECKTYKRLYRTGKVIYK